MNLAQKSLHGMFMQNEKGKYTAPGQGMCPESQNWMLSSCRNCLSSGPMISAKREALNLGLNQENVL